MSNQIETIQKLYAKVKTYKIPSEPKEGFEQISVDITPLSLEDMGALSMKDDMPLSDIAKNAKVLFSKSLGITEEEAGKLAVEFMEDLLKSVMNANNFKEEDLKKTGIKDFIKQKQELIKQQQEKADAGPNQPA